MDNTFRLYQKNQVMTVSNDKLLLMLCDGLVKYIKNAICGFDSGNIQEINTNLLKAQSIVAELMASLDREAGEFADNLFQIYEYLYRGLMEANVKKDSSHIQELLGLAMEVQETWSAAAKILSTGNSAEINFA